jgi:hypothetical protein
VRADEQDIGIASPISILRAVGSKMSAAWIGSESASGACAMTYPWSEEARQVSVVAADMS